MTSKKDAFNRDLKDYLSSRKRSSSFGEILKFKSKPKMEHVTEAGHSEDETVSEFIEEEYEQKKGFFKRLFSDIFKDTKKKDSFEEAEEDKVKQTLEKEEVLKDMKELARISLSVIKQLPPEIIHDFRNSEDFSKLKEILKKHGLIK